MMRSFDNLGLEFLEVHFLAHQKHRLLIEVAREGETYVAISESQRDRMAVDRV